MISIDFIIISYNTKNITLQAIESIYNSFELYEEFILKIDNNSNDNIIKLGKIIVIDNNSNDGTIEAIQEIYHSKDNIKTIKLKENFGYAKACNIGIKEITQNYFVIMNSDIIIFKNTLLGIQNSIDLDFTLIGFQQLYPNLVLQRSFGYYPSIKSSLLKLIAFENIKNHLSKYKFNKYTHKLNLILKKENFFLDYTTNFKIFKNEINELESQLLKIKSKHITNEVIHNVEYLDGAFLLFNKSKLDESKLLFDESYFFYSEEMDLCYNLNKLNYKILFNPNYYLIHFRGYSLENNNNSNNMSKSIELIYDSNLLFCKKYYSKNVTKFYFYSEFLFRVLLILKGYLFFSKSKAAVNRNKIHLNILKKIINKI